MRILLLSSMARAKVVLMSNLLVFTDLDGTLLDHYDYDFRPALPAIKLLTKFDIPIIPNTSKTRCELEILADKLNLSTPFIVENGASIFIPKTYLASQPDDTEEFQQYWVKRFCADRKHWIKTLNQQATDFHSLFIKFSDMSTKQLSDNTGLTEHQAQHANTREFSEPLLWQGTDEQHTKFTAVMQKAGANVLKGGRFTHISGDSNKGRALTWLTNLFNHVRNTHHRTVALGDSYNDNDMLERADIAIQIKSQVHEFPVLRRTDNVIQSTQFGPAGWNECLTDLINHQ